MSSFKLHRSLAYRSAGLYRSALRILPRPRFQGKSGAKTSIVVTTYLGRTHLLMLDQWLHSLFLASPHVPDVVLFTDGTISPEQVRQRCLNWPGTLDVVAWHELVAQFADTAPDLVALAHHDVYSRKILGILATARTRVVLHADTDVLFFRNPFVSIPRNGNVFLKISQDYEAAYDLDVVRHFTPHLTKPPYFCVGYLAAHGDILAAVDLDAVLGAATSSQSRVIEQTVLAEAAYQLGGDTFPANEIFLYVGDRYSLLPSYRGATWTARHYVGGVRHIYWRDALAIRLGIRS